ncbi:hypothetical protein TNCV_4501951 [Trichonephila clavipes]|nr:hypothetical protein TNCV_4501951 [Trichonephila clavipes]
MEVYHIRRDTTGRATKMPLINKYRIGPVPWPSPQPYALVISIETESGFITEDHTSPVAHSPTCPKSEKLQRTLPVMWGKGLSS